MDKSIPLPGAVSAPRTNDAVAAERNVPRPLIAGAEDDSADLLRVAKGDAAAVSRLYDRHASALLGFAIRITKDRSLAEDVVQETFIGMWRNAARFDPARGCVRNWMMSIAHHRAIDSLRRRRGMVLSLDNDDGVADLAKPVPDFWPEISATLDRAAVKLALAELPTLQRWCIELAYFAGMTQIEIAAITNTPLGTVKGRVRLGLIRLRELLASDFAGDFATTRCPKLRGSPLSAN